MVEVEREGGCKLKAVLIECDAGNNNLVCAGISRDVRTLALVLYGNSAKQMINL